MSDERPGDPDDDEGAAGPHTDPDDVDTDDTSDSFVDEPDGSEERSGSSDDADDSEVSDEEPENDADAGNTTESGDDAGNTTESGDDRGLDATPVEAATADGGSEATGFGGEINPHANNTPGPAEGAAPESGVGAPDDQEMPLADHIEEMVRRLGVVIVIMAVVSGLTFPFADRLINFLWYSFLPGGPEVCPTTDPTADAACPYLFHPLALMFARLKVASLVGFIIALPVTVYESYLFMRPGLYPRERRYYLASVPTSLVLAGVGMLFAYLLVLPTLFAYFTGYTNQAAEVTFSLTETFNLIVMMLGFFALVFQIPLLIMLAVMMGVTSREWLAGRRIYFWGGFATVAFLFSPDPTGMAPILVAATMILLFEGTLLLLYWTGEATAVEAEDIAARRPFVWLAAALAGYVVSTAPLPEGYHGQLPAAATEALADAGVTRLTPLFIGLGLIAVYETVLFVYRRVGDSWTVYSTLRRARVAVWPLSLFVGYLGSPDPALLERIDAVDLSTVESAAVAVGLIVVFEVFIAGLRWYQRRE
jgi:sec-independent protein translocase protein TatC